MNRKKHMKKRRKLRTRNFFAIIIVCMICFIIFNNYSNPAKANYTSNVDVDSKRNESAYELIVEDTDYSIWYANSEARHFLFLNFTYNLTGSSISIYTSDFNYDLSPELVETSFLKSNHINNTLEIAIERILIGNEFTIAVDAELIDLEVEPKSPPSPSYIPPAGEEEEKSKVIRVDPITDLKKSYKENPLLAILHTFLVCLILIGGFFGMLYMKNRYTEYPVHYVENSVSEKEWKELLPKEPKKKTLKKANEEIKGVDKKFLQQEGFNIKEDFIKLGRMIREIGKSKVTGKNILLYKSGRNFLLEVHCDDHLDQIKGSKQKKFYVFYTLLRKYTLRTLEIPQDKQTNKYIRKRGFKNSLLFFIARRFPKNIGLSLKDKIFESVYERSSELNKKVLYLQHEDQRDRLKIVADLKYKKRVPDASDPNKFEEEEEKDIPLFIYKIYEKDPDIKDLVISNQQEKIVEMDSIYRSKYRESEDNLRSEMYFIKAELQERLDKKNKLINILEMERAKDQAEFERMFGEATVGIMKAKINPNTKLLQNALKDYIKTGDIDKAMVNAFKQNEKDTALQEVIEKERKLEDPYLFQKMQIEIDLLKKQNETLLKGNGNTKRKTLMDQINEIADGEE